MVGCPASDEAATSVDCGTASLQAAIDDASAGDTLRIVGTCHGPFHITKNLTLVGPATLEGGSSVVWVRLGAVVVFTSLLITGSTPSEGILNSGTLTLRDSTVSGNTGSGAGGIANDGTLTLVNSTVSGNTASGAGGIDNTHTLTLINSTVSGNTADGVAGIFNGGTMTLTSSTVADNEGPPGGVGGLWIETTATLKNTIVADNTGKNCHLVQPLTDAGYNVSDAACGFTVATSQQGVDPLLGPLANNGGPTQTMAVLVGSPAIDQIPPGSSGCGTTVATDQRGASRPQGAGCDVGAFEVVVTAPTTGSPNA